MPITLLPLPAPSTMEMTLRSCLMRMKTHRQLRARLATTRQHRTQPSSLSHLGLLPTMELAGTPLLKTSSVLDPTTFGQSLQVKLPCSTAAAYTLSKLQSVEQHAHCILFVLLMVAASLGWLPLHAVPPYRTRFTCHSLSDYTRVGADPMLLCCKRPVKEAIT